jgi:hypothetical protein
MGNSLDQLAQSPPLTVGHLNLNKFSVHTRSLAMVDLSGNNVGRINIAVEKTDSVQYSQKRMLTLADKANL